MDNLSIARAKLNNKMNNPSKMGPNKQVPPKIYEWLLGIWKDSLLSLTPRRVKQWNICCLTLVEMELPKGTETAIGGAERITKEQSHTLCGN